ncbi:MAG: DNA polymerase III subunit delta [Rhodobacteraceae bacterium]|nr:DNA polymerase III subunit delta [Paracoccaceae bacterium]
MKLTTRDAAPYFAKPDPTKTGLLIYGGDAMRVALKRQQVIAALIGPNGDDEMRLTRIPGGDLRGDPAQLLDAIKAQGFFPGPRVAFVEDANEFAAPAILAALEDWAEGDAQIIVTGGALKPTSKLRKAFEGHRNAYAVGIYDDPPSRDEIAAMLKDAGLGALDRDAESALNALANDLDPGDFRQTVEKIGLYKLNDATPLIPAEIDALAPASAEAEIDAVLNAAAEGGSARIGPLLARLEAQGTTPVSLSIGAARHFRALHGAAVDPSRGLGRVPWKARERMQRQANAWGMHRLERAMATLVEADLTLRSASTAPPMAVIERTFIRLAMMAPR